MDLHATGKVTSEYFSPILSLPSEADEDRLPTSDFPSFVLLALLTPLLPESALLFGVCNPPPWGLGQVVAEQIILFPLPPATSSRHRGTDDPGAGLTGWRSF